MTTPPLREQHGTLILRAGIVVYASEGAAAVVERPVADIVGRRVVDLIVPEQRAAIEERHFRRLRGEVGDERLHVGKRGRRIEERIGAIDDRAAEVAEDVVHELDGDRELGTDPERPEVCARCAEVLRSLS